MPSSQWQKCPPVRAPFIILTNNIGTGRGKGVNIVSFIQKNESFSPGRNRNALDILSKDWKVVVDKKYNQRSLKRTTSS
jgi:hypothetical protein